MQSRLNPYLHFKDNARQAMEFYKSIFGGKLEMSTFKDFGMPHEPSEANLVMHSMLEAPNGFTFMGSDTPSHMKFEPGSRITMALSGDNDAELGGYFNKLAEGGQITLPLNQSPWGDKFGMVVDKFGIEWMVNVAGKKA
ncbi:MAG: VOC family protein [Kofleriaceae bacterium]|nr:VOC family protein [Kofleriaceae bacterium]